MKFPRVLNNKYLYYALAVLAGLNIVGYLSVSAHECLALFVLTAYSAQCYYKNKSVSILVALFVSNFVFGCGRVKEGFKEGLKCTDAGANTQATCNTADETGDGSGAACEWKAATTSGGSGTCQVAPTGSE